TLEQDRMLARWPALGGGTSPPPARAAERSEQDEERAFSEGRDLEVGGDHGDVEAVEVVCLVRGRKGEVESEALGFDEVVPAAVPAVCRVERLGRYGGELGYDGLLGHVDARDCQRVRSRAAPDVVSGCRLYEQVEVGVGRLPDVGLVGGVLLH